MPVSYAGPIGKSIGAIISTIVFGIFSFGLMTSVNKIEPAQDCYAHSDYDYAVPAEMVPGTKFADWTNVTPRLMSLMYLGFWLNLITLVVIVPGQLFTIAKYK